MDPQPLNPLTDVDIHMDLSLRRFYLLRWSKCAFLLTGRALFFKDEAMILYLHYTGYVRISILTSKWVTMVPGPLTFAIPTTDWRCVDFLTPRSNTILTEYETSHCLTPACLKLQSDRAGHRLNVDSGQTCIIYNN